MTSPLPRVLILGASGYVGRALVATARDQGHPVGAQLRPGSPRYDKTVEECTASGAEILEGQIVLLDMASFAPTHVFFVADGGAQHVELVEQALERAAECDPQPRFVYLSSMGADSAALAYLLRRGEAEQAVRESGLGYTICRPGVIHGPDRDEPRFLESMMAGFFELWAGAANLVGVKQHARRYRPTSADELAYGLLHAAFNYTTINRVLLPEELRYDQANTDEHYVPATKRDTRH